MTGETNLQHIAANHTRSVWVDNLQVGAGATTTSIPLLLKNPAAVAPDFGPNMQSDLVGAIAHFLTGVNQGKYRAISAATESTLTIESLPSAPAEGDQLVILRGVTVSVDAPENIAQVGGTTVPTVSGTPAVPVQSSPVQGTLTDGSGTITTANTSQQVFAANPNRRYLLLQNISSATLWLNFTTAATTAQPSLQLPSGASFVMEGSFVSTEAVNIIGGTAGQAFVAKQG